MNKYLIRFNKTRGSEGRGTLEHAWRVFENGKEFIVKHVKISVPCHDENDGVDWNICCYGFMYIDAETSTAIIGDNNEH